MIIEFYQAAISLLLLGIIYYLGKREQGKPLCRYIEDSKEDDGDLRL